MQFLANCFLSGGIPVLIISKYFSGQNPATSYLELLNLMNIFNFLSLRINLKLSSVSVNNTRLFKYTFKRLIDRKFLMFKQNPTEGKSLLFNRKFSTFWSLSMATGED